jgi:hypothetical protein
MAADRQPSDTPPSPVPGQPAPAPQPWERLPEEPAAWWTKFVLFRSLGPLRTLDEAYRAWAGAEVPQGGQRCRAPGAWQRTSREFRWRERAAAFDLHHLELTAQEALAGFNDLIGRAVRKLLASVDSLAGPADWKEFREALHAVGQYVTPEVLKRFQLRGDPEPPAPAGRGGG